MTFAEGRAKVHRIAREEIEMYVNPFYAARAAIDCVWPELASMPRGCEERHFAARLLAIARPWKNAQGWYSRRWS